METIELLAVNGRLYAIHRIDGRAVRIDLLN